MCLFALGSSGTIEVKNFIQGYNRSPFAMTKLVTKLSLKFNTKDTVYDDKVGH